MQNKNKKGFTLVEIMIVVVIIGLLAAMAIPAFQKVRTNSIGKTIINDARQIGSAAQQYFMEEGVSTVTFAVAPATGALTSPLTEYVSTLSKGISFVGATAGSIDTSTDPDAVNFTLQHALGTVSFNNEGRVVGANPFE